MKKVLPQNIQIVILAGGKGKRLSKINNGLPKPLTPVINIPIIEHQIRFCKSQGFSKFLIVLSFKSEVIVNHFKENPINGINIDFFKESSPRGTGGALLSCLKHLEEYFFVIYSDTFFTVNLSSFIKKFEEKLNTYDSADGLIFVHPNNHPQDSDLIELNSKKKVIAVHGYPFKKKLHLRNVVNAAFYLLSKNLIKKNIQYFDQDSVFDIAKDLFPLAINKGFNIFGIKSTEYIKDMGTPERLDFLEKTIDSGNLNNLSPSRPKRVVFIDRDGCINKEKGRIINQNDLELIEGSAEGIKNFNLSALPVFCITNQPVIARGDISEQDLDRIHAKLDLLLGERGAFLDEIYYCPHHPDKGFKNEIKELKKYCNCRKPNSGLIFKAAQEHNIDLGKSWIIGDTTTDIAAGKNIGLRSVLVNTGYGGRDLKEKVKPDYIFENLKDASKWITKDYGLMKKSIIQNIDKILKKNIVLISGFNHIGKSNYAEVLKEVITDLGFTSHTINTINWMKDGSNKFSYNRNLENYDLVKLINFIESCIYKKFPIYFDHKYKLVDGEIGNIPEIFFKNSILIIEGPPLLRVFETFQDETFKIFKKSEFKIRRKDLLSKLNNLSNYYKKNINLLEDIENNDISSLKNYLKYCDLEVDLNC